MAVTRRGFSNVAAQVTLSGTLDGTSSTNTITVNTTPSGWPGTLPYFAAIDKGTASEEVVLVTAQSGTSMTITRGGALTSPYGSTTKTHSNGATIQHVGTAQDWDEANAHTSASSGVHGITGAVVGTTDTQTLSGKTLSAPVIADLTNAAHDHGSTSKGGFTQAPRIVGVGSGLVGTPPAVPSTAYQIQATSSVITYVSGGTTISFPAAFPTGVLTIIPVIGDSTLDVTVTIQNGSTTTSAFVVRIFNANGAEVGAGGNYRINWVAYGW